jgi:hypothetical protein
VRYGPNYDLQIKSGSQAINPANGTSLEGWNYHFWWVSGWSFSKHSPAESPWLAYCTQQYIGGIVAYKALYATVCNHFEIDCFSHKINICIESCVNIACTCKTNMACRYNRFPPTHLVNSDVGGVYMTLNAWLVPDDPTKPYNLENVRYICSIGGTVMEDYNTTIIESVGNATRQDSDGPRQAHGYERQ